jgi:thiamine biosynthesis lipoprotein
VSSAARGMQHERLQTPGAAAPPAHRRVANVMGMPISLAIRGRHAGDERGAAAWESALATLRDADRVFSTYRPDSLISRLARGELRLQDCPPEVVEVLELGERARQESGGAFDIRRPGPDGAPVLDPSGVVKGWAVERAAQALDALPATDFCLSAGGDMVCRVKRAGAAPWRIGIEDPRNPGRVLAVAPLFNDAIATSGSAHRGDHVVDARSGRPPLQLASVTVIGPDLVWADIDATAAFALDSAAVRWLEGRSGRRGLVVSSSGESTLFGVQPSPVRDEPATLVHRPSDADEAAGFG